MALLLRLQAFMDLERIPLPYNSSDEKKMHPCAITIFVYLFDIPFGTLANLDIFMSIYLWEHWSIVIIYIFIYLFFLCMISLGTLANLDI